MSAFVFDVGSSRAHMGAICDGGWHNHPIPRLPSMPRTESLGTFDRRGLNRGLPVRSLLSRHTTPHQTIRSPTLSFTKNALHVAKV